MNFRALLLLGCLFQTALLVAQTELPSPDEFLQHTYTEQFTAYHELIDYFELAGELKDNVQLIEYGRSNEHRPLVLAFVSTDENINQLDAIRQNHLRRTGLEDGPVNPALDRSIVWLSFGVHGNEAGATESSMNVLHKLASGDESIQKQLENTIVIIDPAINPDGFDRYTHWYRQVAPTAPDPSYTGWEHQEPWPGGRVNHYLFDLNRDWAWATQVETQQRLVEYGNWLPHIHADFHEQYPNEPYYFAPAAQPFHAYITDWQGEFQTTIGSGHANRFDANGWLYFTREIFDLLYPSYGDTYPTFNGSIGMTYEQGGHGMAGRSVEMENGDTLTLADRVAHHTETALSTVETASKHSGQIVEKFQKYYDDSRNNPPGEYKSFLIPGNGVNPDGKIRVLCRLMDRHGIQYGTIEGGARSVSGYSYRQGENVRVQAKSGDLVISAYQPKGVLAQVLFEPETYLEDSLTYDITAWSLPYAYGLEAYAAKERIDPSAPFPPAPRVMNQMESKTPYAYLARWKSMDDARFLSAALKNEIKVRFATEPFELGGIRYDRGTLIFTRADNRKMDNFDELLIQAADMNGKELLTAKTGFATSGKDLGSATMKFIERPQILVLGGEKTGVNPFGQLWYYFEQVLDYPVTIAKADALSRTDLSDYNLIVMPSGRYDINEDLQAKLTTWIQEGGRIIAIGSALRAWENKKGFQLKKEESKDDGSDEVEEPMKYAERERSFLANFIPGAIIQIQFDQTHPLGFGMDDTYFSLKTGGLNYPFLESGWNVGYTLEDPRYIGFVGSEAQDNLSNRLFFGIESKGGGSMIYMVDNPLFRGFWEEGHFLFSNAVFFAGQ
jgi:hypothetical protein